MKRWFGVLSALGALVFMVQCVLVTGSTSGYSLPEAGCSGAADCDDAARCCLSLSVSAAGIGTASVCQSGSQCRPVLPLPGAPAIQLCERSAECADDAACLLQQCSPGDAASMAVTACGHVFGCTPL